VWDYPRITTAFGTAVAGGRFSSGDKAGIVYGIDGLLVVGEYNQVVDHGWNDLE